MFIGAFDRNKGTGLGETQATHSFMYRLDKDGLRIRLEDTCC